LVQQEYAAPRNETEQQLADIWMQLLKIEKAGIHDNFFDLGGHSLHALRMLSAVNRQFSVNISFQTIFSFRSIAELAGYIELVTAGRTAAEEAGQEVFEI
jgi:acyl carrier protein